MQRRPLLAGLMAGLASTAVPAFAQPALSSRPIRIVVPFGAGGVADITARTVAQKMGEQMGQSVVVDNRPGAGGIVAGELVAKADPDGHTLLLMSNGTAVSAGLFRSMPFDARKDFAPISLLAEFDLAVIVPENSRFRTIGDFISFVRANPGQLNLGTINIGSTQHLAAELLRYQGNLVVQVVPYNGTPAVINALRGGQIDAAVEILGPVKPQITAKALRALAVMGAQVPSDLPGTSLVSSQPGLSNFNVASWNALAAPARTPAPVLQRLNDEVRKALAQPDVQKRLSDLNVYPRASSPAQLTKLLDSEIVRWSDIIVRAGVPRQ